MKFAFKCLIIQILLLAVVIARDDEHDDDHDALEEWSITKSDLEFLGESDMIN